MKKVILFLKGKPSGINTERFRKIACSLNKPSLRKPVLLLKNRPSAAIIQKFYLVYHIRRISKFSLSF